jgi:hypothetical protein
MRSRLPLRFGDVRAISDLPARGLVFQTWQGNRDPHSKTTQY